jgi:hypothetical protein
MSLPRLITEDLDDPAFLGHFEGLRLTGDQKVALIEVLKSVARPLDQVIAEGRATEARRALVERERKATTQAEVRQQRCTLYHLSSVGQKGQNSCAVAS